MNDLKWRLPTKDELNKMYENLHCRGVFGFANTYYWSSSGNDSGLIWYQHFYDGYQNGYNKSCAFRVRAVRTFETPNANHYEIGQELTEGFVFDIVENRLFICKKEDEEGAYNWYEAMKLFEDKYDIVVNEKTITLSKQEATYLKNVLNELLK